MGGSHFNKWIQTLERSFWSSAFVYWNNTQATQMPCRVGGPCLDDAVSLKATMSSQSKWDVCLENKLEKPKLENHLYLSVHSILILSYFRDNVYDMSAAWHKYGWNILDTHILQSTIIPHPPVLHRLKELKAPSSKATRGSNSDT